MTHWSDFQSALQFVAGLNIALYGVRELRAPGIADERRQEADLVKSMFTRGWYARAVVFGDRFDKQWAPLIRDFKIASVACLVMGGIETVVLFRGSGQWASCAPDLRFAWGAVIIGLFPTIRLLWLNLKRAPSHRVASLMLRQEAESLLSSPVAPAP
jgi:hypothetical protein